MNAKNRLQAVTSITIAELCARWRTSRMTICRMLRNGRLRGYRVGAQWRIPLEIVEAVERGSEA